MNDMDRLGPWPDKAVAVFRDLGLTEQEIARYFHVHPRVVRGIERDLRGRAKREMLAHERGQTNSGKRRSNETLSDGAN